MANVLEYTLSLNDKLSEKLRTIGINSEKSLEVFSHLEKQTQTVNKVMGDMGKSVATLQQKLALLKAERDWVPAGNIDTLRAYNKEIKSLEKEINKLQTTNGGKIKTWFKDAFSQLPGAGLITNPLVAIGAGLTTVSKLGMEAEQTAVSFEVLTGSQEKANQLLNDLNNYAAKTPYSKLNIQDAAKQMMAFGVEQEKVMPYMRMMGDIAMGDAGKLQSLTLAFSQIQSAGKLTGQDLLQLVNAGFNPLQEISRTTGESYVSLREKMEKGQISAQMVAEAFRTATSQGGKFYNMTEKIGQTTGAKLSTLLDNLRETAIKLFDIIGPVLNPVLDMFGRIIEWVSVPLKGVVDGITWFYDKIKEGHPLVTASVPLLAGLAIGIKGLSFSINMASMATKIWTGIQAAFNAVMAMNPVVAVVAAIAALITMVVLAYQKVGWFRGIIKATWEVIKGFGQMLYTLIIDRIISFVRGIGKLGEALYKVFKRDFKGAWAAAKDAAMDITGVNTVKKVVGQAKQMGQNAALAYHKGVEEIENKKQAAGLKNNELIGNKAGVNTSLTDAVNAGKPTIAQNPETTKTAETIQSGGARNVTINLRNLIENVIYNGTMQDNKADLQRQMEESFIRLLQAAYSAG